MPEHLHYSDEELFNPETSHEHSDVNVRALIWFFVLFVIFAIITHLVLWWMYRGLVRLERGRGRPPLTAMQRPPDASVPQDQPLLQPFPQATATGVQSPTRMTPVTDLEYMRAAEEKALTTYGWVDQQKGTVRIPIDVAKRLVVERGLAVQRGTQ